MLVSSDFIKALTACLEERTNGGENEEVLLETNPNAVRSLADEDAAEKGPEETTEASKVEKTDEIVDVEATDATTEKNIKEEEASKEESTAAEETPNYFINAFKTIIGFDAAAVALAKKEAAQPEDESRNDDTKDAILVASEIRPHEESDRTRY